MLLTFVAAALFADPAARLDAFLKAHPTFAATVEVSANGKTVGAGTLKVMRPRRLRFDAKGQGFDYSLVSTDEAYVEVERVQKLYDERPSTGGIRMIDSRISPAQELVPKHLIAGSTAGILGPSKPTVVGDELRATVQSQGGPVELRLVVDAQGRPARYSVKAEGQERSWRLLSFGPGPTDASAYRLDPPLGYVPYALPDLPIPLAIGEAAPLVGWRKAGRAVDLNEPRRGSPRLLALLGPDCPASRAARPFLIELGRSMPVFLLEPGGVEDPTGRLTKTLSPPGTPMFYLVGVNGAVKKLWFGFDGAKGAAWEAEVEEAAKA